jgi:hypothetical protein
LFVNSDNQTENWNRSRAEGAGAPAPVSSEPEPTDDEWTQNWTDGKSPWRALLDQSTLNPSPYLFVNSDNQTENWNRSRAEGAGAPAPVSSEPEPEPTDDACYLEACGFCGLSTCDDCLHDVQLEEDPPSWEDLVSFMRRDQEFKPMPESADDAPQQTAGKPNPFLKNKGLGEARFKDTIECYEALCAWQDTYCHICKNVENNAQLKILQEHFSDEDDPVEDPEVDSDIDFVDEPDPDETDTDSDMPLANEESDEESPEKRANNLARQREQIRVEQEKVNLQSKLLELQGLQKDTDAVPPSVLDSLGVEAVTASSRVCTECMAVHGLRPKKAPKKTTQSSPKVPKDPDRIRNDIYCLLIRKGGSTPVKFNSLAQLEKHVRSNTSSVKVQEQTEEVFSNNKYANFEFVQGDTKVLFYWTNVPADASEAQEKKANKIKVKLADLLTKTPVQN